MNNTDRGVNPAGNLLDNDSDVDHGDTKTVVAVETAGEAGTVGGGTTGQYGRLVLTAGGAYEYIVDNNNPQVQALRTAGETLTEVFTYTMRDAAGVTAQARLVVTIAGRDDTPVARDDSNSVNDVDGPPTTEGNVLDNDSDVDGGDELEVSGIRAEQGDQQAGAGERLAGRYGYIVMNADGSYRYEIDLSNADVEAARGRGPILSDVFVYTVTDLAGQQSQARLTIVLDLDAAYVDRGDPHGLFGAQDLQQRLVHDLNVDPVVFVTPAVRDSLILQRWLQASIRGQQPGLDLPPEITIESLAAGLLEQDHDTPLTPTIQALQWLARYEDALMQTRYSRVFLSADGLLRDDSAFAYRELRMQPGSERERENERAKEPGQNGVAPRAGSFSEQIRASAGRPVLREAWRPDGEISKTRGA
ncbi:VCBS domain-containing protein [Bordetella petrii]|nr:VCBS domain-containing protein [Bordetella petrii]